MRASIAAFGLLSLFGCTQTAASLSARLLGTHDLAILDRYVFVASTDNNELRVLDLAPPGAVGRRFVQAPNPLEVLSVPVLDRPTIVVADAWFSAGLRVSGHYVYASRPGAKEVSIVDASRPTGASAASATSREVRFRELRRLPLPGPVTALAASHDASRKSSVLYVATYDGQAATVFALSFPEAPSDLATLTDLQLQAGMRSVVRLSSEPVVAVAPVGSLSARTARGEAFCAAGEECLLLATRKLSGRSGRTVMVEPSSGQTVALAFPGPLRALQATGRFELASGSGEGATQLFEPGQRIFGLLDEELCGSPSCGGVVAVDTVEAGTSGFPVARDFTGAASLPIGSGMGLMTGFLLQPGGALRLPAQLNFDEGKGEGVEAVRQFPLLGLATSSNGELLFFDAARLKHIDNDLATASVASSALIDSQGTQQPWVEGPQLASLVLADGAWRTQELVVVWEGSIPGLTGLSRGRSEGSRLAVPAEHRSRVGVGDAVVFSRGEVQCGGSSVVGVYENAVEVAAVPGACSGWTTFSVQAGQPLPYVVMASRLGYLGRAAPGEVFTYNSPASRFAHLPGYDATTPTLRMAFAPASPAVARDWSWVMSVDSHFLPYAVVVDTDPATSVCSSLTVLPGTPAYDVDRGLVFVAYPSANAVAEVNPSLILRGFINRTQGTICHQ